MSKSNNKVSSTIVYTNFLSSYLKYKIKILLSKPKNTPNVVSITYNYENKINLIYNEG